MVEANDDSEIGWQFDSTGLGSFGELSVRRKPSVGTEVALCLRTDLFRDVEQWWHEIVDYVRATVVRVPCCFQVHSDLDGCDDNVVSSCGWLRTSDEMSRLALAWIDGEIEEVANNVSSPQIARRVEVIRYGQLDQLREMLGDARHRLRWHSVREMVIKGVGKCRIHVPFFELEGGAAPLYMKTVRVANRVSITPLLTSSMGTQREATATGTEGLVLLSWKGMSVRPKSISELGSREIRFTVTAGPRHHTIVELDCCERNFGTLSLNREWIDLGEDAEEASIYRRVAPYVLEARADDAQMHLESPYAILHYVHSHQEVPANAARYWLRCSHEPEGLFWDAIEVPATKELSHVPHSRLVLGGKVVREFADFKFWQRSSGWGQFWPFAPSRVVVVRTMDGVRYLVPIWDDCVSCAYKSCGDFACTFPPEWDAVVGALTCGCGPLWNSGNELVRSRTAEGQIWLRDYEQNAVGTRKELLDLVVRDRDKAIAFLLNMMKSRQPELWADLVEENPDAAREIWSLSVGGEKRLVYIAQELGDEGVRTKCFACLREGFEETNELDSLPLPVDWLMLPE